MNVKRVAVQEFEEHPSKYLDARETLWIERDGMVIGYYVPVDKGAGDRQRTNGSIETQRATATPEERREALEQFDRTIERVLAESGMTREELADLLDLSKPFPYDD